MRGFDFSAAEQVASVSSAKTSFVEMCEGSEREYLQQILIKDVKKLVT